MAVRVLHVLNNLGSGGAESFIMNIYRTIDREKVQFDFLIRSDRNGSYVDEIKSMGGHVYILPPFPQKIVQNYKALDQFFRNHPEYRIVHVHANSLMYVKPLQLARKYGIPCRIIHSHSVSTSPLLLGLHWINKHRIKKYVTARFACSKPAGRWMFCDDFQVINNGIDISKFEFNASGRNFIRKKYGIEDKRVIGHVGRFTPVKNHKFVLQVFQKYLQEHAKSVLLLVGEGPELPKIKALAKQMNISENVIFAGSVSNVEDYLSAMDVLLFPSIYEGLGIVLVEAQAGGLPCVLSEGIPRDVVLNDNCRVLSLRDSIIDWVDAVSFSQRKTILSKQTSQYRIESVTRNLECFYLTNYQEQ